ncbi:MAG: 4-hydroxy-3-methylbut-2-enyl diphosphate reductase, partial [Deltaproteobacteria bacterium]|nr:4-hydroxy-3-methylbut-2-enyl diphosphate reductase [Deltaproteobacteria bacterium]
GPLVHNPQVIDLLKHRDIGVAKTVEEISGGVAIIRTHGVSPQVRAELETRAEKIFDQTCPVVVKVQKLVDVYKRKGHFVVIYGEHHHPEVQGLIGFAGEGNSIIIDKAE